ncbi:MAG: diguanylate cyclase [Gammaproteobacteria bacterium]|nr:diguanylate cyclase [Gammaproteobacteria bacterium]
MNQETVFKQRALIIVLIILFVCTGLGLFGFSLANHVIDIDKQWTEYDKEIMVSTQSLALLESHLIYDGVIADFKKYISEKDKKFIIRIENDLREIYQAINDYPLNKDHPRLIEAHSRIKNAADRYAEKFELAQKLIAEDQPLVYSEFQMSVEEHSAIESFRFLKSHMSHHSHEQQLKTNKAVESTLQFLSWGTVLFPVIILAGGIIIVFIRYNLRINQKLEINSQYRNDIFNAAPDAMIIVDEGGAIKEANSKAVELFGYSQKQLYAMTVESLMPERFRRGHPSKLNSSFKKTEQRALNNQDAFCGLRQDGTELPIEISLSYTKKGNKKLAITIIRDVSERKELEKILQRSEDRLKKAQRIANMGSWEWNISENKLTWSEEIYKIFGANFNDYGVVYDDFVNAVHPDDRDVVIDAMNEAVLYDRPYNIEHRIVRPDGEERFVHERGDVFRGEEGEAQSMVGTVLDITEQKKAERELRLADNVFDHAAEAIVITDTNSRVLRVNSSFTRLTGYSAEEAMGEQIHQLIKSEKHEKSFFQEMWKEIDDHGCWEGEIWDKRKDGTLFLSSQNISEVKDDKGVVIQYTSIFSDITDKKIAEERIKHLAEFDQLTGLPNRELFKDRLDQAVHRTKRNKKEIALLFIDLDAFKSVNDTYGHQTGDELLQEVAQRLLACVREQDTVARLGGDEFMIILESLVDKEDAALVAEKVIKSLSNKIQLGKHEASIGASIGISVYPDDGVDQEALIKYADMAMYQAKSKGKNQYQYYSL